MTEADYRALTSLERDILQRLLEADFAGCEQLQEQLEGLRAKQIDDEGSLGFEVKAGAPAPVEHRVPVEAHYSDDDRAGDGAPLVHILLHVREGRLWMLEIYKDDGSPILQSPDPPRMDIWAQTGRAG
jgi:hypothetical protein